MEKVGIDLMGPFAKSADGNKYIVVIQDHFTKWVAAEAIPNKHAKTVADVLYRQWITKYGCPKQLHSDQGGEFTSKLFQEMCSKLRMDQTRTAAYRPQPNDFEDRSNRSLQAMLRAYVSIYKKD